MGVYGVQVSVNVVILTEKKSHSPVVPLKVGFFPSQKAPSHSGGHLRSGTSRYLNTSHHFPSLTFAVHWVGMCLTCTKPCCRQSSRCLRSDTDTVAAWWAAARSLKPFTGTIIRFYSRQARIISETEASVIP